MPCFSPACHFSGGVVVLLHFAARARRLVFRASLHVGGSHILALLSAPMRTLMTFSTNLEPARSCGDTFLQGSILEVVSCVWAREVGTV